MNLTTLSFIFQRVRRNISTSPYLHLATTATIAFSLLIIGAFGLVYVNINNLIRSWQDNIRVVAYLSDELPEGSRSPLQQRLARLYGVGDIRYISKDDAMDRLKRQMKHRLSLLEGLRENPLPASFEIRLVQGWQSWNRLDPLVDQIKAFPEIEDVECGQAWLRRFSQFIAFFKLASLIIGVLIVATTVFVCTNTIKLTLYTKRQELDIMRLVGATDAFIQTPFYIQNLIEGLLGGLIAVGVLFGTYRLFISRVQSPHLLLSSGEITFLSLTACGVLLSVGMLMGWLGFYLSVKQFLRP
jgi:cell division transport system permease protein